jgi:hypothetical protein
LAEALHFQGIEIVLAEVGVDVHIEIEFTARVLSVAVEEMPDPFGFGQPIDGWGEKQCHAQVRMKVDYRRKVFHDATKAAIGSEFEVGKICQAPIPPISMNAVGPSARALLFSAFLAGEPLPVGIEITTGIITAEGGDEGGGADSQ